MDALVKARSNMIATLNSFCGTLEDRARRHRSGFRDCGPGAVWRPGEAADGGGEL